MHALFLRSNHRFDPFSFGQLIFSLLSLVSYATVYVISTQDISPPIAQAPYYIGLESIKLIVSWSLFADATILTCPHLYYHYLNQRKMGTRSDLRCLDTNYLNYGFFEKIVTVSSVLVFLLIFLHI